MKNWNIEKVVDLLLEAGKIALNFYDAPKFELKQDNSIVTIADKKIEDMLSIHFDKPEENVYLIGEETVLQKSDAYIKNALKKTAWIVDPIDGTAPYAHHIPTWGISIAYMINSVIKEGAIFLPATGELFITSGDTVYYKSCINGVSSWDFKSLEPINTIKKEFNGTSLICISQEVAKNHRFEITNNLQSMGCAIFPLVYLAKGRILAYISGSYLKIWDYAAGAIILKKCGFCAKFLSGADMKLNIVDDVKANETGIKRWEIKELILFTPDIKTYSALKEKIQPCYDER